jgi:hypothetical protein
LRLDQDRSLPRDSLQQISTRSRAGHCVSITSIPAYFTIYLP